MKRIIQIFKDVYSSRQIDDYLAKGFIITVLALLVIVLILIAQVDPMLILTMFGLVALVIFMPLIGYIGENIFQSICRKFRI